MKLFAQVAVLCLGCFAHRGAAVSVRGLTTHHAGHGSLKAVVDDKPEDDVAGSAASSNVSSIRDAASEGVQAANSSVVVPSDLAALLNDAKAGRVDPSKFKETSMSLNVVGDLLKQVGKANDESKKSLYIAAANIGKCQFPKLPFYSTSGGWKWAFLQIKAKEDGPHAALNEHHKCLKEQAVTKLTYDSCEKEREATLIARNYACKVDSSITQPTDVCFPSEAEGYEMWTARMKAYYDEMDQKVDAKIKECARQNRILAHLAAGPLKVGSCKYKLRKHTIKTKECEVKKVQAKAATCRLMSDAQSRCHTYKLCYEEGYKAYYNTERAAREQVVDQKLQWQLLSRAKCLSDAMDASTGKIDEAKMDKCIDKPSYNTSHLNLTYPTLPRPSPCVVSPKLLERAGHCSGAKAMTMYQRVDFGGSYMDVYGNLPDVGGTWDDRLSSLVVYPRKCVNLYQHTGYRGAVWRYCAGDKKKHIGWVGKSRNNRVSSIRIEDSKLVATFYTDRKQGGEYTQIYENMPSVGERWRDKLKSLIVFPGRCVTVYARPNYGGFSKKFCAGGKSLKENLPLRLRKSISIRVQGNRNFVASLYDGENLVGRHWDIKHDEQNLLVTMPTWNDRISSLIVYPHQCLYVYDQPGYRPAVTKYCAGSQQKKVLSLGPLDNRISSFMVKGSQTAAMVYTASGYLNIVKDRDSLTGPWNDKISSLVAFPHKCIVLYTRDGFRGTPMRSCGSESENRVVSLGKFTNKASSIRVEGSGLAATLYVHSDFGGRYLPVYGSEKRFGLLFKNRVKSLVVYPGYCVTLYWKKRFKGNSRKECAGSSEYKVSNLGASMNGKASSIKVEANR